MQNKLLVLGDGRRIRTTLITVHQASLVAETANVTANARVLGQKTLPRWRKDCNRWNLNGFELGRRVLPLRQRSSQEKVLKEWSGFDYCLQ